MVRKSSILVLVFALLFFAGCKSKKVAEGEAASADIALVKNLQAVTGGLDSYSAKVKMSADAKGKSISSSGTLKVKEGAGIQLGITPMGLFEAARVDFLPGSATLINKMKGEYAREDYASVPVGYELIESVFLGKLFIPQGMSLEELLSKAAVTRVDGAILLATEINGIKYSYYIDSTSGMLLESRGEYKGGFTVTCVYGDFTQTTDGMMPARIVLALDSPSAAASLTFLLSKIKTPIDFAATIISPSYKKVSPMEILNSLGIK